ncbi:MAG: helicase C-terminal domain-containing protein [Spirochaetota bacterium]
MDAAERIDSSVVWSMRGAIGESEGSEVLFLCDLDDDMRVTSARVVARGVPDMVAAPMEQLHHGQVVIHNHPSGSLQPSRADVSVAAELADSGVGSYIIDNDVTELLVVVEPAEPHRLEPLDADELAATIDDGGALSDLFQNFEPRQSQVDMLRLVVNGFNENRIVAVEAGTGVGKSFAYLVPALAWADRNDERVVVSTATINLQQQLVEKDIPTVQRLLGVDVPVMLVKGRGNYLCRKRLGEAFDEESLFAEDAVPDLSAHDVTAAPPREETSAADPDDDFDSSDPDLQAIRDWARSSDTGSRSELPFTVSDELWNRVNSDADSCTELTCRMREDCFFLRARRQAAAAKVLVANHHLLFIDLALRVRGIGFETRAVLPPFQRLVFDEAHSIENSATSLFSESFSRYTVRKHSRRLRHSRRDREYGLLAAVRRRGADAATVVRAIDELRAVDEAAEALDRAVISEVEELTLRITRAMPEARLKAILDPVDEVHTRLVVLANTLGEVMEDDDGEEGGPFYDLRVVLRRIESLITLCDTFTDFDNHSDRVFWVEVRRSSRGGRFARLISSPLDIRGVMREAVFDVFDTAVFTSATLTVAGSFDYWAGRVGLLEVPRETDLARFASPFPYREHALVAVPTDAPEPSSPAYQGYLESFLGDLLEVTEGRALVLFTSYEMLRAAHRALRDRLAEHGIVALRQGDEDRARLLARFSEDISSVLFATESFWQGVDVPGESLRAVVLCRLPFRVPTDPILLARTEAIEARGGNAFGELSLPEAVMKFRQGFGRLMRRGTDRGIVVVTDVRVLTKRYGSLFLQSLPETHSSQREASGVLEDIERFLYS